MVLVRGLTSHLRFYLKDMRKSLPTYAYGMASVQFLSKDIFTVFTPKTETEKNVDLREIISGSGF